MIRESKVLVPWLYHEFDVSVVKLATLALAIRNLVMLAMGSRKSSYYASLLHIYDTLFQAAGVVGAHCEPS